MPPRDTPSPRDTLVAALGCFGLAALLASVTVFREEGPLIEREARFMGCERIRYNLWQLQFYPGPTSVRLETSSAYDQQLAALCARQARVRVVAQEKATASEPVTWLQGLVDLDSGAVLLSAEDAHESSRKSRLGGGVVSALFVLGGLLLTGSAVRRLLYAPARPAPIRPPRSAPAPAPAEAPSVKTPPGPPVRKRELGPSWFVRRSPLSAVLLAPLAGVGILAGGVSFLRDRSGSSGIGLGYWAYNLPLGLVLVGVGGLLLALSWGLLRVRTEVFREGIAHRTWRGELVLPFRDLKTFSYAEHDIQGLSIWTMAFVAEDGRTIGLRVQPDVFREKELPRLRDALAEMLCERMLGQLDTGAPWMPGVEIRRDGVHFPGTGQPPVWFSKRFELRYDEQTCTLRQGNSVYRWPTGGLHFYPGLRLLLRLTGQRGLTAP